MEDSPVGLGIVVSQYLDHIGIRDQVCASGIDQAAPVEAAHEAAGKLVEVLNDLVLADA
jgi:hypothetical protein